MNFGLRVKLNELGEGLRLDLARIDEIWSEGIERFGGPWLGGPDFTAVDAFFAPVAFRVQTLGLHRGEKALGYVDLILKHSAMQEWYEAAMTESWREAGHEIEIAETGTVLSDHRA